MFNKWNFVKTLKENREFLAGKVHDAWWEEKKKQGFHSPNDCNSSNHESFKNASDHNKEKLEDFHNSKFYKWCDKCHADMYPYNELEENIKDYDRVTVDTVIKAIEQL